MDLNQPDDEHVVLTPHKKDKMAVIIDSDSPEWEEQMEHE